MATRQWRPSSRRFWRSGTEPVRAAAPAPAGWRWTKRNRLTSPHLAGTLPARPATTTRTALRRASEALPGGATTPDARALRCTDRRPLPAGPDRPGVAATEENPNIERPRGYARMNESSHETDATKRTGERPTMVMPQRRERVLPRLIEDEMRESFLDYSMSVIVQRALPDVRDGLKPVHRRILYAMHELGLSAQRGRTRRARRWSARCSGSTTRTGMRAVYDSLVRMVQDFSLRYPLVDGQGNFGSIDGDSAAAYRYTEARLAPLATRAAGGHREGHRRLRAELRRPAQGADGPAGADPEPAGQRQLRDRGRDGDEHPAAQPARGRGRAPPPDREPGVHGRRPDAAHPGPGLPDRRLHPGRGRDPQGVRDRPWPDRHACAGPDARRCAAARSSSS